VKICFDILILFCFLVHLMLCNVGITVVADLKYRNFELSTKPQLLLYALCALKGKYIISSLKYQKKAQKVQVLYAQGSCLEAK